VNNTNKRWAALEARHGRRPTTTTTGVAS